MYFFQQKIENFYNFKKNWVFYLVKKFQDLFERILKINIIYFYILREVSFNYLGTFLFLILTVYVEKIFYITKLIIEYNIPIYPVLIILPLYLPLVAEYVLPITIILATLISMGRLSDDQEIIAMRSCGISFLRISTPVISFGIFATIFMLIFFQFFLPEFKEKYRLAEIRLIKINPLGELVKKLQFKTIDGGIISIEAITEDRLEKIWIKYPSLNKLVYAPYGYLLPNDEKKNLYPLILFNTSVQPMYLDFSDFSEEKNLNTTKGFDDKNSAKQIVYIKDHPIQYYRAIGYQYFSLSDFYKSMLYQRAYIVKNLILHLEKIQDQEFLFKKINTEYQKIKNHYLDKVISLKEKKDVLDKMIERKNIYLDIKDRKLQFESIKNNRYMIYEKIYYYFFRPFSFAFSAIAFSLLGISLGILNKRSGKTINIGLGILILSLYLILNFLGEILLQKEILKSAFIAALLPNFLFYPLGIFLFLKNLHLIKITFVNKKLSISF